MECSSGRSKVEHKLDGSGVLHIRALGVIELVGRLSVGHHRAIRLVPNGKEATARSRPSHLV